MGGDNQGTQKSKASSTAGQGKADHLEVDPKRLAYLGPARPSVQVSRGGPSKRMTRIAQLVEVGHAMRDGEGGKGGRWAAERERLEPFTNKWLTMADLLGLAFGLCLDPECCGRARILAMQVGGQLWGLEAGAAAAEIRREAPEERGSGDGR